MSAQGRRQGFRMALAGCLVAVTILSLIPPGHEPLATSDKINHLAAFLVLGWLADHAYPRYSRRVWWVLLAYGLLIEVVQALLPYRDASALDLLADGVGLMVYLALARSLQGRALRRSAAAPTV